MVPIRRYVRDWIAHFAGRRLDRAVDLESVRCVLPGKKASSERHEEIPTVEGDKSTQEVEHDEIISLLRRIIEYLYNKELNEITNRTFERRLHKLAHRLERRKFRIDFAAVIGAYLAAALLFVQDILIRQSNTDAALAAATTHIDNTTALIASNRPWIQPTSLQVHDFHIADNEVIVNMIVHYENVGHSPARNVGVKSAIYTGGASISDATNQCPRAIQTDPKSGYAKSVFAGQPGEDWSNLHIPDIHHIIINGIHEKYVSFFVAGCLFYEFDGSRGPHYTTFMGTLARRAGHSAPGNGGESGIDVMSDGPVSPSDLDIQIVDVGTTAN